MEAIHLKVIGRDVDVWAEMTNPPGKRRDDHMARCAAVIVGGIVVAMVGFVVVSGAIGWVIGGAGIGTAAVGLRGAVTGESPRLF